MQPYCSQDVNLKTNILFSPYSLYSTLPLLRFSIFSLWWISVECGGLFSGLGLW